MGEVECKFLERRIVANIIDIIREEEHVAQGIIKMKGKVIKNFFLCDLLIPLLLILTLIPLNLTNPEDTSEQTFGKYDDLITDNNFYSKTNIRSRTRDFHDQNFSSNFTIDFFQQVSFDSVFPFFEQIIITRLLSYRFICLPPPPPFLS